MLQRAVMNGTGRTLRESDLERALHPVCVSSTGSAAVRARRTEAGVELDLPDEGVSWSEIERAAVRKAYERHGGCIAAAARYLGMSYHSFLRRAKRYGIHTARSRS